MDCAILLNGAASIFPFRWGHTTPSEACYKAKNLGTKASHRREVERARLNIAKPMEPVPSATIKLASAEKYILNSTPRFGQVLGSDCDGELLRSIATHKFFSRSDGWVYFEQLEAHAPGSVGRRRCLYLCVPKTISVMTHECAYGIGATDGRVSDPAATCYPVAVRDASAT